MQLTPLTFKSIRARAVVLKLKRPVVARIATITDWPLILIDLFTDEGVVGRSYLEPYTIKTMKIWARPCKISAQCSRGGALHRSNSMISHASRCTLWATKGFP